MPAKPTLLRRILRRLGFKLPDGAIDRQHRRSQKIGPLRLL